MCTKEVMELKNKALVMGAINRPNDGVFIPVLRHGKQDKDRDFFLKSCKGKVKYDSISHGEWSLNGMIENGLVASNEKMNVYPCKFCKHWHIGHKETYAEPQIMGLIQNMIKELDEVLDNA